MLRIGCSEKWMVCAHSRAFGSKKLELGRTSLFPLCMKSFWFLLALCSVLVSFECVGTEREPLEPHSVLCQLLKEKQYEAASVLYFSEHEWKQDQAAQKMLSGLSEPELFQMAESKSGRRLLSTMYAALVTGNSSEEELHDAQRILIAQSLVYYGRDEVQKKLIEAPLKHFPLRLPGVSVTNPTQLRVSLSQDGVQIGRASCRERV